ncbi:hypothetical protein D3C79_979120 [compost metagenome]
MHQRVVAVGGTGCRRHSGICQYQRPGLGFHVYFSGRPAVAVPANQLRLCGDARSQLGALVLRDMPVFGSRLFAVGDHR